MNFHATLFADIYTEETFDVTRRQFFHSYSEISY